jgi:uncharacterized protein YprB with RNaseH-like and TPR domain
MLQSTFLHIPGIGEQTESKLWSQGILTWEALAESASHIFSKKKAETVSRIINESLEALETGELRYFSDRLKSAHIWRLIPECIEQTAYLDIETTGLGFPPASHSTTIAIYFGGEILVEYDLEKKRELLERIQDEAKLLVTFNGLSFDLPYLRREFSLKLDQPHLDLRVWLRRHDLTGGLKRIQTQLTEIPQRSSMDIDGFDAVRLWHMHKRGVPKALETLATYNAEDTICLEPLLHYAYRREREANRQLNLSEIIQKPQPKIATQVDPFVYALLRGEETWNVPEDW